MFHGKFHRNIAKGPKCTDMAETDKRQQIDRKTKYINSLQLYFKVLKRRLGSIVKNNLVIRYTCRIILKNHDMNEQEAKFNKCKTCKIFLKDVQIT